MTAEQARRRLPLELLAGGCSYARGIIRSSPDMDHPALGSGRASSFLAQMQDCANAQRSQDLLCTGFTEASVGADIHSGRAAPAQTRCQDLNWARGEGLRLLPAPAAHAEGEAAGESRNTSPEDQRVTLWPRVDSLQKLERAQNLFLTKCGGLTAADDNGPEAAPLTQRRIAGLIPVL
mmetsp:Transcript_115544/g.338009  ORF Transcript_115544/g.338009 Transcript_115544/m.338009 type:complete len:178 (+) Transcript_115544:672-1205(+)